MTTGALIFAFNNEHTDYVRMAAWSAANIRRHLDIPVAVVTNTPEQASSYSSIDQVIAAPSASGGTRWFEDYAATVTWHNASRIDAYHLSPWDRTLVLDADYVVAGPQLQQLTCSQQDFVCHRWAMDMTTGQTPTELNSFGRYRMPMYWATVMMFGRNNTAQYVFDSMAMIRNNWQHYRDLYHIDQSTYRNDFALSIALGIVSGHTNTVDTVPWPLVSVMPDHQLLQIDQDHFNVIYRNSKNQQCCVSWSGFDFHAMGKQHLEKIIASH